MTDHPDYDDLRKMLRYRREQAGLSVDSLAHACGASTSTIFRLEAGRTSAPKAKLVAAIARELDITSDDITAALPEDPGLAAEINSRLVGVAAGRIMHHLQQGTDGTKIIAITPEGGIVNASFQHVHNDQVAELITCLEAKGYTVTRPI